MKLICKKTYSLVVGGTTTIGYSVDSEWEGLVKLSNGVGTYAIVKLAKPTPSEALRYVELVGGNELHVEKLIDASDGLLDSYRLEQQQELPKSAPEEPVRSSQEIIKQTEEVALAILRGLGYERLGTVKWGDELQGRPAQAWRLACEIQEILTDTDVANAIADVEG